MKQMAWKSGLWLPPPCCGAFLMTKIYHRHPYNKYTTYASWRFDPILTTARTASNTDLWWLIIKKKGKWLSTTVLVGMWVAFSCFSKLLFFCVASRTIVQRNGWSFTRKWLFCMQISTSSMMRNTNNGYSSCKELHFLFCCYHKYALDFGRASFFLLSAVVGCGKYIILL